MMKTFRYALMSLGAVLLCAILLIEYTVWDGHSARADSEKFVSQLLADFSRAWQPAAVGDRFTQDNIEQFRSAQGMIILKQLSDLGQLRSIENFSMRHHQRTATAKNSIYEFVGGFDNGTIAARVHLQTASDGTKVKILIFSRYPA